MKQDRDMIFENNLKLVKIGALIKFIRNDRTHFGIIQDIRDMTAKVAVDISDKAGMFFDANRHLTVVNHANYEIITTEPDKYITDLVYVS